ncbi:CHAT domain-containing tetratricopeptide repeat protein [Sediminitomix flava]|nr:CHAT domain-containing tetratricopeptide repeat protein [Sediminitomix flava]
MAKTLFRLLTIVFICHSFFGMAQKAQLKSSQRYYQEGEYAKALQKIEGKVTKRNQRKSPYAYAVLSLYKARYEQAMGNTDFEVSLTEAIDYFQEYKERQPLAYAISLLTASELYLKYSDIHSADSYLKEAEAIINPIKDKGAFWDKRFEEKYLLTKIGIAKSKGHYNDASFLTPRLQEVSQGNITSQEKIFSLLDGKVKTQKVLGRAARERKRNYAHTLTLEGEILRLHGNYELANITLKDGLEWIKKALGKNDPAYAIHYHEYLMNQLDKGIDDLALKKEFEKNLFKAERVLGLIHHEYLKIHEDIISYYSSHAFSAKRNKQWWEINHNITKYYGRETPYYSTGVRLDALNDYQNKNYKSSRRKLLRLINDIQKTPDNHEEKLKVLELLYKVSVATDELQAAKTYQNQLLDFQKLQLGEESLLYHMTKTEQALHLMQYTNEFDHADSIYHTHFNENVKGLLLPTHKDYTAFVEGYANFSEMIGNFTEALSLSKEIEDIKRSKYGTDHLRYASGLNQLADVEIKIGKYEEADSLLERGLNIFNDQSYRRGTFNEDHAALLETAARYNALLGLYDQAQSYLNKSERLSKRIPKASANSSNIAVRTQLYIHTEKYSEAQELLEETIKIRKERYGDSSRFLIEPYGQFAELEYIRGNYTAADSMAELTHKLSLETFGEGSLPLSPILQTMANIKTAIGDYKTSQELIRKSLAILTEAYGENHVQVAQAYTELALVSLYEGSDPETVQPYFQKAVDIIENQLGSDTPMYASALRNLALNEIETKNYDEARNLLLVAQKIFTEKLGTAKNTYSANIEMILGDLETKVGTDFEKALNHYLHAKGTYSSIFSKNHPLYVDAQANVGRAYYNLDNLKKARKYTEKTLKQYDTFIKKYFPALTSREKTQYWLKIKDDFEFYSNLSVQNPKNKKMLANMYANTLETKSLLLDASKKIRQKILASNDSILIEQYSTWENKKAELVKLLALSQDDAQQLEQTPKQLEKEINDLEKELSKRSGLFSKKKKRRTSWKDVRKSLAKDETAIELIRFRHFDKVFTDSVVYAAMVVNPTGQAQIVELPDGNYLEKEGLGYYRTCIEFELKDTDSYTRYWEPIAKRINENNTIYLSAEGVYNQMNLEALLAEDSKYVLDRNHISLISSTKDLIDNAKKPDEVINPNVNEIALFGNPVFYNDLSEEEYDQYTNRRITQLPGTLAEVKRIQDLLSQSGNTNNLFIHKEATEEAVKKVKSPKVFHIATHGFFLEDEDKLQSDDNILTQGKEATNPLLRSGLLLTNAGPLMDEGNVYEFNKEEAILTAYEAMSLDLDETELVVLSACETGRGDDKVGEGVYGLQRAFIVAGANAIIMSLFEVSDEATQELMSNFYRNWLEDNMEKKSAFVLAKKQLREKFDAPKYWAPFIMVGGI